MAGYHEYDDYCDHLDGVLKNRHEAGLYFYKRRVLDEMEARTKEILSRGLGDKKVAHDLVIDEYGSDYIIKGYDEYLAQQREKLISKRLPVAFLILMLTSVAIYLAIGFLFHIWHPTWLIIEGCATASVIGALFFAVSLLERRKKFYFLMRLLVAGSVMVLTQFAFLLIRIGFGFEQAYLVFIVAAAMLFVGDIILATATKQKLLIINYLVTIPVLAVFVYVILGLLHVISWGYGWVLIPLAVVVDLLVLWGFIRHNRKYIYKPEVQDEW